MKRTLIIMSLLMFAVAGAYAQNESTPYQVQKQGCESQRPPKGPDFAKRHAEFEKRLKLTDEQKAQAKKLREQGFEQMKPLMDKVKEKRAEIDTVRHTKMVVRAQNERIEEINREIDALQAEMHRLRMENMKSFEAILTKSQLKELKKMKKEGRKKFEKEFKKNHKGFEPPFPPRHEPMPLPCDRPVADK